MLTLITLCVGSVFMCVLYCCVCAHVLYACVCAHGYLLYQYTMKGYTMTTPIHTEEQQHIDTLEAYAMYLYEQKQAQDIAPRMTYTVPSYVCSMTEGV